MKITNIEIREYTAGNLKAFVEITLENAITMKNFKIIEGKHGLFVSFPSQKNDGKYYDTIHYVYENSELTEEAKKFKKQVNSKVLEEYDKIKVEEDTEEDEDIPF